MWQHQATFLRIIFMIGLGGCFLTSDPLAITPLGPSPTPTIAILLTQDAAEIMAGICFEAAADAAGRVFVLRNAGEQIHFYDLADNSHLCRSPVERVAFDFDTGRILAGMWSKGSGCTATHEIVSMNRDDAARTVTISARFVTEGDCGYELVRPFWLALDRVGDYAVTISLLES
jgi:hypothetical protein